MGVNRVTKRGKSRIEVRKRWPDGTTFRRYYSNKTIAKHMLARLEESIVTGTWPELKDELTGKLEAQRPITFPPGFPPEYQSYDYTAPGGKPGGKEISNGS